MNIAWTQIAVALILLWIPRQWLRIGGAIFKRRSGKGRLNPEAAREPGDNGIYFRVEFAKFRNYVDFFRAAIGGLAVTGGIMGVQSALLAPEDASGWHFAMVRYMRIAILLIGVLIQSFRFEKRAAMFPPIFYISGLTFGVCGLYVALFAIIMTWAINTTLPGPTAFLTLYAATIGIFGYFLTDDLEQIIVSVGLVFSPVLLSLLAKRRLVHFSKKVKASG